MDPMVSSRIPASLRDRVNTRLKEIGSNPTELINKAYEYVDVTGELPQSQTTLTPGTRHLTQEQKDSLAAAFSRETFAVPESYFTGKTYDDILEAELRNSYEALL